MAKKLWLHYLAAYLLWLVSMALSLAFLLMGRSSFPILITAALDTPKFQTGYTAIMVDRAFTVLAGIYWLVLMVYAENDFRSSVKKGRLWYRAARLIGFQLILVFVANLALTLTNGSPFNQWVQYLLLLVEIALGILLVIYSYRWKPKPATPQPDVSIG
ncbi:MAG: hypothetical protein GX491_10705 [Chloroflexi bacterium]|nr:hypothetical protein [Chloroflexota bacterium]